MHEHKCSHDGCNHAALSEDEMKRLKNNGYRQDLGDESWKTYVIRNKKSGKIAEIRAASAVHASNLIGWRPRHIEVIQEK